MVLLQQVRNKLSLHLNAVKCKRGYSTNLVVNGVSGLAHAHAWERRGFECAAQSRSQSPRYPYPTIGMGNKDLWKKVFCLTCVVKPEVQESCHGGMLYPRGPCCLFLLLDKGN